MAIATEAEDLASPEQRSEVRQIRQKLDAEYASRISSEKVHSEMGQLAQSYKKLREQLPSGPQRTMMMESVAGRMRALTPKAALSSEDVKNYLRSNDEGERLLGLSILEWTGDVSHYNDVLQVIDGGSRSAFEQYRALRIAEKMLPRLDSKDKRHLQEVLNIQRDYDEEKHQWISYGSDRWLLSERLLSEIGEAKLPLSPES